MFDQAGHQAVNWHVLTVTTGVVPEFDNRL